MESLPDMSLTSESETNPEISSIHESFLRKPQIIRKHAQPNEDYYIALLKTKTNLFQIGLNKEKAKEIMLYGIDVKGIYPRTEEAFQNPRNPPVNSLKKTKEFKEEMNKHFDWYYISGLLLFGKPKNIQDKLFTLNVEHHITERIVVFLENEPSSSEIEQSLSQSNAEQKNEIKVFVLKFTQKHCILDSEETSEFSQIYRNFINVCMGKVLKNAGYYKDATTRKIYYYKQEAIQGEKVNDNDHSNHKMCFYPAVKAVCDSYEGDKVYFKITPRNILYYHYNTYLDYFQDFFSIKSQFIQDDEIIWQQFVEKVVKQGKGIKKYNHKIEKIEDVIYCNPFQLKFNLTNNQEMSVGEYYLNHYDIKLDDKEMPIAVRYIDKGGKLNKETAQKLYVPLSELMIIGNIYENRINMKDLIESPDKKHKKILDVKKEILNSCNKQNKSETVFSELIDFNFNEVEATGFILKPPVINVKSGAINSDEKGGFRIIDGITPYEKLEISCALIILVNIEQNRGQFIYSQLKTASQELGISIPDNNKTREIRINQNNKEQKKEELINYLKDFSKDIDNKKDNIIFMFLDNKSKSLYPFLKKCLNEEENLKVPSQCIVYDEKKINNLSVFTNILIQIYGKLGRTLFYSDLDHYKNTLVISYSTTRVKNKILTSLCMNYDKNFTKYMFLSKEEEATSTNISPSLNSLVYEVLNKTYKSLKRQIQNIIVYRDGVNDKQMKEVEEHELSEFFKGLGRFQDKIKNLPVDDEKNKTFKKYYEDIKVCFIVANKINDIKIFRETKEDKAIINIPIGIVFDTVITQNNSKTEDFHLNSAHTERGTAGCTHYTILHDDTNLSANEIYKFTYTLTYTCYNTTKSIKIPAPLYFVNRRNNFTKACELGTINQHLKTFNISL